MAPYIAVAIAVGTISVSVIIHLLNRIATLQDAAGKHLDMRLDKIEARLAVIEANYEPAYRRQMVGPL